MMNTNSVRNDSGVTIVELVVALGLTALLLILVGSGALFVRSYVQKWKTQSMLSDEIAYLSRELSFALRSAKQVSIEHNGLTVCSWDRTTSYTWNDGAIFKDSVSLLSTGHVLDTLSITSFRLPSLSADSILNQKDGSANTGVYQIYFVLSHKEKVVDSLKTVVVNRYESAKFSKGNCQVP